MLRLKIHLTFNISKYQKYVLIHTIFFKQRYKKVVKLILQLLFAQVKHCARIFERNK